MTCATPDINDLKDKLAQAEAAYHLLLTGSKAEQVTFGPSKSVKYTQSNLSELRRYINDLKEQIGKLEGCPRPIRRTVRMIF